MIERLEGRLLAKGSAHVHLQTGPLCLEIQAPLSTLETLAPVGETVSLWTHLQWKEDGPSLFGFATEEERLLFRLLIGVQGVGPRIALSLLSHLPPDELVGHLRARDEKALVRVPGIGAKTAARILVELGEKADRLALSSSTPGALTRTTAEFEDAVSALTALGYPAKESRQAIEAVHEGRDSVPLDEALRLALRHLSRKPASRAK